MKENVYFWQHNENDYAKMYDIFFECELHLFNLKLK